MQTDPSPYHSNVTETRRPPDTHRRRDSTVELRRVGIGSVNTIRN